jgi:hypothetical protein
VTTPTLITVAQLRQHLKLPDPPDVGSPGSPAAGIDDADLQLKIDAATQLVCDYIADRNPADPDWIHEIESWDPAGSPAAIPPPKVILAVLIQAAEFYRYRGDDAQPEPDPDYGCLQPSVQRLLSTYKNRAFA